jgi:hypothetical protein
VAENQNTRTIEARYAQVSTGVDVNLIEGCHDVMLNHDAGALPGKLTTLSARQARQLAAALLEQANEADRRNGRPRQAYSICYGPDEPAQDEPVDWAGRTFGQLSPDERARATRKAAGQLQAELTAAAPAIAQVLADSDVAELRQIENEQRS